MRTTIILGGYLGRKFGRTWNLDLDTPSPGEAVRALSHLCKGFRQFLLDNSLPGYHVFVGRKSVTASQLKTPTAEREIIIMPALTGAKSGWIGVVVGGLLVAAGVVVTVLSYGGLTGVGLTLAKLGVSIAIGVGVSMAVAGVNNLLSQSPEPAKADDEKHNYLFTGPVNTVGVGNPVPVCYGKLEVGSQVVSAMITQTRPAAGGVDIDSPVPGRHPGSWHDHMPKDGN